MPIYKIMRCSGCGAPIKENETRKEIYVEESSTDKPNMQKRYVLHLCYLCASAFNQALDRATEWERKE